MRWYYGWNVVAVGIVFQALSFGLTIFMFTFWAEAWMEEFGVDRAYVTLAYMTFTVGSGAISPFAGRAFDEHSIRALVIGGAVLLSAGFVLIAMTTAMWQIIALYATFIAAGSVLAGPLAAQTLSVKWFRARRGMAIGWASVGTSAGGLLLPPLVIYLLLNLGWRGTHVVLAALVLVVIVPLVGRVIRNTPEGHGIEPEPERPNRVPDSPLAGTPTWTTRKIVGHRNFWIPSLAFWPVFTAYSSFHANLRLYAADIDIDPQSTAFLMSLLSGTMIGGKLFFGTLSDRVDHRRLYWIMATVFALSMVLLIGRPSYGLMVTICGLLGFAAGGLMPLLGAIIGSRFGPRAFGRVFGLIAPFLTLSSIGSPLAGWIRDTTGSYDIAFQLILVILAPAVFMMVLLGPQHAGERAAAR